MKNKIKPFIRRLLKDADKKALSSSLLRMEAKQVLIY